MYNSDQATIGHVKALALEYERRLNSIIQVESDSELSILQKKLVVQRMINEVIQDYQEDLGNDLKRTIHQHLELIRQEGISVENTDDDEFTLRDFLKRDMKLLWLVPGYFTLGSMYILAAKAKSGKTDFVNYLSRCITITGKFLGLPCTRGTVLWFQVEESGINIRLKGKRHGYLNAYEKDAEGDLHNVVIVRSLDLANEFHKFESKIEKYEPVLVILDTIRGVMARSGLNECNANYADVFYRVQSLAIQKNITVICLHHTRKGNPNSEGGDPLDEIAGTSKLPGIGDGSIILKRQENSNNTTYHSITRDIGSRSLILARMQDHLRNVTYTVVQEIGVPQNCLDQEKRILFLLKLHERLTESQIAEKIGASVSSTLDRLCETFLIDYEEIDNDLEYFIPLDAVPLWENILKDEDFSAVDLALEMTSASSEELTELSKQHDKKEKDHALHLLPQEEKVAVMAKRFPPKYSNQVFYQGSTYLVTVKDYIVDPETKHPVYLYRLCSTLGEELDDLISEHDLDKQDEQLQHDH